MKHILLQFAETPDQEDIDLSIVEYSDKLNLNVLRGTDIPAITYANHSTQTFTKSNGEGTDSDKDMRYQLATMLRTSTETRAQTEQSDKDANNRLETLLSTKTQTYKHAEESDEDRNLNKIKYLNLTRTLTESAEDSDADK